MTATSAATLAPMALTTTSGAASWSVRRAAWTSVHMHGVLAEHHAPVIPMSQ